MGKYRTIRIPNDLLEEVKREIEISTKLGYRNPSEFIIEAIRRRLEEVKKFREKE